MTTTEPQSATVPSASRWRWRVVDIVVASVVAVASSSIFLIWNVAYSAVTAPLGALLPGLQSLGYGAWLFAGVLTALIVRKPGAAIYGELVAAAVSALIGNQWGASVLVSGLLQGLGAELVFAAFLYANWRLGVAILAGAGAGLAMAATDIIGGLWAAGPTFGVVYTICGMIGGALVAGLLSWLAVRALARTGALSRFGAGRDLSERI